MNKILIILLMLICVSCNKEDAHEEIEPTAGAEVPYLIPADSVSVSFTRASVFFDTKNMVYSWEDGDAIGVFNVSVGSNVSNNNYFGYMHGTGKNEGTTASAHFYNGNFAFSDNEYWVAYSPFDMNNGEGDVRGKVTAYNDIRLTYRGQRQMANAAPNGKNPTASNGYGEGTERAAGAHLAAYDYLISAPATPDELTKFTTFKFTHIGATVRFFMLFPKGAFDGGTGNVTSMKLVSTVHDALVSDVKLAIKPYTSNTTSYEEVDKTYADELELLLGNDGNGIQLPDNGYLITYMKFYPVSVTDRSCYLLLTAEVNGVKKYFKSKPLPAKTIVAGKWYQWATNEFNDPIELTATLLPWEDIQGGSISTGEE